MVLNNQDCHKGRVQSLKGHPTCSIPHCRLQETSTALNLAIVFSISRHLKTGKFSSTVVTPSPSSNIYLCPVSLPGHHPHSSSLGRVSSRQLPLNGSVETPLCGCALLTPCLFSPVPPKHELMSRRQEAARVALEWASTHHSTATGERN